MALPAPILSGPSTLYLGLAAHKYSNKVHLSTFLLEKMLDEMVRTTQRQQLDKSSASRLLPPRSTFAPALPFGCLLIEYVRGDKSNQPRLLRGDWQIGGVITATKHARCKWGGGGWHRHRLWPRFTVCVHGCIQDVSDRHVGVCPAATFLFPHRWSFKKINKKIKIKWWRQHWPTMLIKHFWCRARLLLICRTGHTVQTDCCMLCLVHRETSGLCMVVKGLRRHAD